VRRWILILAAMLILVAGLHFVKGELEFASGLICTVCTTLDADEALEETAAWDATVGPYCPCIISQGLSAAAIHELVIRYIEWRTAAISLICQAGLIPRSPPRVAAA
jgi:hypothetical protein